jgi:hypothetical protein
VSGRFQYQSERPTRGRAALNYASLLLTSLFRFFTSLFRFRSQLGSRSAANSARSFRSPGLARTADVSPTVPLDLHVCVFVIYQ